MDLWGIYRHHQSFPRRRKEVCKKCAKNVQKRKPAAYYKRYSQVEKYTYRDTRKRTMITRYLLRTIKELIVQFSYRYIVLFSSLYVVTPICREREKKEKRENNVTVRNASESTWKENPGIFFCGSSSSYYLTCSFCFSFGSSKLDECKVSMEAARLFHLNEHGINENREMSQEYSLVGGLFYLFILFCHLRSAKLNS